MIKPVLPLLIFITAAVGALAQNIVPNSQSASMAKDNAGTSSIDYSTGIMTYTIPLASVQQDGITVPISISYTASGQKVDDVFPGVIGFGWTLNNGASVISRMLRGSTADEDKLHGILYNPNLGGPDPNYPDFDNFDSESDIFSLNIAGKTVQFFLKKVLNKDSVIAIPLHPALLKIICHASSFQDRLSIDGWTVTDDQGNIYDFIASSYGSVFNPEPIAINSSASNYCSSWYLSKTQILNKGEIDYIYDSNDMLAMSQSSSEVYTGYSPALQISNILGGTYRSQLDGLINQYQSTEPQLAYLKGNLTQLDKAIRNVEYSNAELLSIVDTDGVYTNDYLRQNNELLANYLMTFDTANADYNYVQIQNQNIRGQIDNLLYETFNSTTPQYNNVTNNTSNGFFVDKTLKQIKFKNYTVDFHYRLIQKAQYIDQECSQIDISTSSKAVIESIVFDVANSGYLKQVRTFGLGGLSGTVDKQYSLDYFPMPTAINLTKDYWGFYSGGSTNLEANNPAYTVTDNGKSFDIFPVNAINQPSYYSHQFPISVSTTSSAMGWVKPDSVHSKCGTLKSISSNDGSIINFDFEGNDVYLPGYGSAETGGIRIKSIEALDSSGASLKTLYRYNFPLLSDNTTAHSSGRLNEWGQWTTMCLYNYGSAPSITDTSLFTSPVYLGKFLNDRTNNGTYYSYVEEVHPDGSYTGYKYPSITSYGTEPTAHEFQTEDYLTDLLLAKINYNNQGKIVEIQRHQYMFDDLDQDDDYKYSELSSLNEKYSYIIGHSAGNIPDSVLMLQSKRPVIYYDKREMDSTYLKKDNEFTTFTFAGSTYKTNVGQQYISNFIPRYTQYTMPPYSLYTKSMEPLMTMTEDFIFNPNDYNDANNYLHSNFNGLPNEKQYLYEFLINAAGTSPIKTVSSYSYDNQNIHLKKVVTIDSKGNYTVTNYTYPTDYLNTTATDSITLGIRNLNNLHVLSPVIEKSVYKSADTVSTGTLVNASFTSYLPNKALVSKIYGIDMFSAVTDFSPSSVVSGQVKKDTRYTEQLSYNVYDNNGNVLEQQKHSDVKQVTLWGYNAQYPVAKITGLDYNSVKNIANQGVLDNSTSSDASIRAEINKIKAAYPSANVLSYTYSPGVGITSQADNTGELSTIDYDGLNRPFDTKDGAGNVLKYLSYAKSGLKADYRDYISFFSENNNEYMTDSSTASIHTYYYNDQTTQAVVKSDCPPGSVGWADSIFVPANTVSAFSLGELQQEMNAYMQSKRNPMGGCLLGSPVSFDIVTNNLSGINASGITMGFTQNGYLSQINQWGNSLQVPNGIDTMESIDTAILSGTYQIQFTFPAEYLNTSVLVQEISEGGVIAAAIKNPGEAVASLFDLTNPNNYTFNFTSNGSYFFQITIDP